MVEGSRRRVHAQPRTAHGATEGHSADALANDNTTGRAKPAIGVRSLLIAFAVGAVALAVLVSRTTVHDEQLVAMRAIVNQKLAEHGFEVPTFNTVMPDAAEWLDSVFESSQRWFETLDFKVGRDYARKGYKPEYPVIMLPGIISTGLESWTTTEAESSSFRERVWGSGTMIRSLFLDKEKWLRHMSLDPVTGLDPDGVKVRAAEGLDAASYFAAGYWIWNKVRRAVHRLLTRR